MVHVQFCLWLIDFLCYAPYKFTFYLLTFSLTSTNTLTEAASLYFGILVSGCYTKFLITVKLRYNVLLGTGKIISKVRCNQT